MNKHVRRKQTAIRKKSGSTKLIVVLLACGGGLMLLLIGVALYFFLVRGINPLGPGFSLGLPNPKVTPENYSALKSGSSLTEVEAILGKGQPPTSGDFDAICGLEEQRYTNPFFKERATWEENNRRGLMLIWINGPTRVLITFSQSPNQGGRLLVKVLLRPDGSVSSEAGNSTMLPPTTPNTPQPNPKTPSQNADPAAWNQLVGTWEIEGDPRFRIRFGADREIGDIFMYEGWQLREKIYFVREVKIENGRMAPQLDLGTVNGQGIINAALGVFWFENGTLHRDLGNGKPTQKLRRVNP